MPNQILKLLLSKEPFTPFQWVMITEWNRNADEQELNYYTKILSAFF